MQENECCRANASVLLVNDETVPYTDIYSTTWPQIQPLLRPSPGLCIAYRIAIAMQNRNKVQGAIELPVLEFFKYL